MVRPFKGRKHTIVRGFSFPGEYEDLIESLRVLAFNQKRALSDLVLESLLEYSKQQHLDVKAPELLKALQERDVHPTAAEKHKAKVLTDKLKDITSKKWPDARAQLDRINRRLEKALDFNERAKVPELSAAIERARLFAEKL